MASRRLAGLLFLVLLNGSAVATAQVVNSQWVPASGNWNVAGNWSPVAAPDNGGGFTYNVQIGTLAPSNAQVAFVPVTGTSATISTLSLTDGADLFTNGFQIISQGQTTIDGAGTTIRVDPHGTPGTPGLQTVDLDLNNGGALAMSGGIASVGTQLEVNVTAVLQGHGTVNVGDFDVMPEQAFENSGLIQVQGDTTAPRTLTIHANGVDTIDLDGDTEAGAVDVDNAVANVNLDTLTLVIDGPLDDAAGGTIQIGQRDTLTFTHNFSLTAANVSLAGGSQTATLNGAGDATSITGSTFTSSGAAVIANDLVFSGTANTFTAAANSTLTLGGTVAMPDASMLVLGTSTTLVISGATTINEAAGDFDWDGTGANATTTVQGTGLLAITANRIDTNMTDQFDGTLNLNDNGDASVNVAGTSWTMAGTLNKNNAGTSSVTGDALVISGTAHINVNAGTLTLPATTLQPLSTITVNGTLELGGNSAFTAPGSITGTGTLRMLGTSTVTANTTIGTTTFDWDGTGTGTTHTINNAVTFTINSTTFDSDGDMDDPLVLAGAGSTLTVNGSTQWAATATITANQGGAGTATIGGTSRFVLSGASALLNVDGNTTISAPLTFGASSLTMIDATKTLDATNAVTYAGGTIDGIGTYSPGTVNTVTADSAINPDHFDFDSGIWAVESGAQLTFNVNDYDGAATNAFDSTITLNNGAVLANSADPEFVMDGILKMNASGGNGAEWSGDPIDVGNDAGVLDADVNVTGDGNPNSQGRFFSQIDFNSDADVDVAAGASLVFNGVVVFDTVNGGNNAEFTGAGTMAFNNAADLHEAVTLNMVGGTVDLDGNDATGEFINIDAPLVIKAATMSSFGRVNGGGGVNTLDINNNVGTGVLTVNLDDPNAEWTLNAAGVMNLVNDVGGGVLLAGSDVNLDGTVNVTGAVGVSARVDIAGTVNVAAGSALTLQGGNVADPNRMVGGTINGPGFFSMNSGNGLRGFGTINPSVNYAGTSQLLADDGQLTLNGAIADVGTIGTADADGVLNVVNAWNSSAADNIVLIEGQLKGGTITVTNANGIKGRGLVSARVINNSRLEANVVANTLVFETGANDNDWDGAGNMGLLSAVTGGTLELRDNATFGFTGTVSASSDARVYSNGFALDFNPGSTLSLQHGTYESTSSTDLGGAVTVLAGGGDSTIKVQNNFFLTFETGSATTLNANLRLENNNINVEAGATFGGTGALVIPNGSHLVGDDGANINVLLDNEGAFRPGNFEGIGAVSVKDYQQTNTGQLFVEIKGTLLNQYDRVTASGIAQLDGYLNVDIDEVSPGVPFVPIAGNLFNIMSAPGGVVGTFDYVDVSGFPPGLTVHVNYLATIVQLQVVATPIFSADFDDDGDVDPTDLAIWRGAFHLNQLGDADGDNDSDGNDFLLWQRQVGSHPVVAVNASVPEPASLGGALLTCLAAAAAVRRRRR